MDIKAIAKAKYDREHAKGVEDANRIVDEIEKTKTGFIVAPGREKHVGYRRGFQSVIDARLRKV